jgi:hypothetical protein
MKQRALFGLERWGELPEEDRRTVIRDIVATVRVSEFGRGGPYRNILAKKSQAERDEIRGALTASGLADMPSILAGKNIVQALGM